MTFVRSLLVAAALSPLAFAAAPASAHTVCRPDGVCFNTSGTPIPYYDQPAYRGGYADESYGAPPYPYPYHHHYYRHYRHYYDYHY